MRKLICCILALSLLLAGCGNSKDAKTVKIVTGTKTPETSEEAASVSEARQEAQGLIAQLAADLKNPAFSITAESPETEGEAYTYIQTDEDFGTRVAAFLLDNEPVPEGKGPSTGRKLTLRVENENIIDNAAFYGPAEGDKSQDGHMKVQVELSDGRSAEYYYDKSVFTQLDALFKEYTQGVKTELKGNSMLIAPKYDLGRIQAEQGFEIGEFLQFGNRILWRFIPNTEGYVKPSTIEMLDTVTGKSLYSYTVPETVIRMEKFDGEEGFDYRVITQTGILYKSSGDRSREKVWRLPGIVSLFSASQELSGTFDMQWDKLAYASGDGIYLSDTDGGNAQPILFHNALPMVMQQAAGAGYTYYFNDPRFLLGGKRLVTSIVSPQSGTRRLGFAVTNLDTMETNYLLGATASGLNQMWYLGDKAVCAQDEGVITLINAENNDRGALPLNGSEGSLFFTQDCKTFVVWEPKYTGTSAYASSVYTCGSQNISDRSRKLLGTYGGAYVPVGITEEYFVGFNEDSRGVLIAVSRYQTVQRPSVAGPESFSSTGEEPDDTVSSGGSPDTQSQSSEEGATTLPPDITPDL